MSVQEQFLVVGEAVLGVGQRQAGTRQTWRMECSSVGDPRATSIQAALWPKLAPAGDVGRARIVSEPVAWLCRAAAMRVPPPKAQAVVGWRVGRARTDCRPRTRWRSAPAASGGVIRGSRCGTAASPVRDSRSSQHALLSAHLAEHPDNSRAQERRRSG